MWTVQMGGTVPPLPEPLKPCKYAINTMTTIVINFDSGKSCKTLDQDHIIEIKG